MYAKAKSKITIAEEDQEENPRGGTKGPLQKAEAFDREMFNLQETAFGCSQGEGF
jgi:hypothetical protein